MTSQSHPAQEQGLLPVEEAHDRRVATSELSDTMGLLREGAAAGPVGAACAIEGAASAQLGHRGEQSGAKVGAESAGPCSAAAAGPQGVTGVPGARGSAVVVPKEPAGATYNGGNRYRVRTIIQKNQTQPWWGEWDPQRGKRTPQRPHGTT